MKITTNLEPEIDEYGRRHYRISVDGQPADYIIISDLEIPGWRLHRNLPTYPLVIGKDEISIMAESLEDIFDIAVGFIKEKKDV